jgi:hypothetical protein
MTNARPLVFFHIMKCAGTSVRGGLTRGVVGKRRGPEIFELDGQAAIRAAGGTDDDNWRFRDALLPYVCTTLDPQVVLGHFRYRDRYAELLGDAILVTVLRDPLERFVSLYRYRRYKSDAHQSVSMPFDEFVSSRWSKDGHAYVDTFCGRDGLDPASDEAVSAAVDNLRKFAVVGRADRLDDFAREVTAVAGREVTIPRVNVSPAPTGAPPEETGIDDRSLEQARLVCAPDYRVYGRFFGDQS